MQFAYAQNGERIKASPYGRGICPNCRTPLIAKCGELNVWHWAHENLSDCDSWQYEPITKWHLGWQAKFPEENREIHITKGGETHIADITTESGLVIEIQNSPISTEEISEREYFYKDMLWVINSQKFKHNLVLNSYKVDYGKDAFYRWINPDPDRKHGFIIDVPLDNNKDIINSLLESGFIQFEDPINGQEYWRNHEPIYATKVPIAIEKSFTNYLLDEKLNNNLETNRNYKTTIHWKKLSRSWLEAKKPLFIDLNNRFLLYVKTLHDKGYGFGLVISERTFLQKYKH